MSTYKYLDASIVEKNFDAKTVEETREMSFIISTATKDRGGEVINMDNWQLERYKSNPIVGYQHEVYGGGILGTPNPDYIIGKSSTNLDSFQGKRVLVSKATFEPEKINPLAEKIFQKLLFGSLNAASVGILPVGPGTYKKEEKTYYYEGQELLEWSVVNIPMNGEARRMSIKSLMTEQANDLFQKIHVDEKLKQIILDQIEKEYGTDKAEQVEVKLQKDKPGIDPDLVKMVDFLKSIKQ